MTSKMCLLMLLLSTSAQHPGDISEKHVVSLKGAWVLWQGRLETTSSRGLAGPSGFPQGTLESSYGQRSKYPGDGPCLDCLLKG